jgi:Putative metal-binding motif
MQSVKKAILSLMTYRLSPSILLIGFMVFPLTPTAAQTSYTYTAETKEPVAKKGDVFAGGLKWVCAESKCTTTGSWSSLGIGTCWALHNAVGEITNYGRKDKELTKEELVKCNGSITLLGVPPLPLIQYMQQMPAQSPRRAGTRVATPPPPSTAGRPCTSNDECDDGLFCNGTEVCRIRISVRTGVSRGYCSAGTAPDCDDHIACSIDSCSEYQRACQNIAPDRDGDGHGDAACIGRDGLPLGDDCDDADSNRYPGNAEVCNNHDEDCNPDTIGFKDDDLDGYVDRMCTNPRPDGTVESGPDCDDGNPNVHPGAAEFCNGVDDNCDGIIDNSAVNMSKVWVDRDRDGFGDSRTEPLLMCVLDMRGYSFNDYDCDDSDPGRHPGAGCP